jgi:predicted aconitase
MDDLRVAFRELTTADGDGLDMVFLGCPHFSWTSSASSAH